MSTITCKRYSFCDSAISFFTTPDGSIKTNAQQYKNEKNTEFTEEQLKQ